MPAKAKVMLARAINMSAKEIRLVEASLLVIRHPTLHKNIKVSSKLLSIKRAAVPKTAMMMVTRQWRMPATRGMPDMSSMVLSDLGSEAATCRHTMPATTST